MTIQLKSFLPQRQVSNIWKIIRRRNQVANWYENGGEIKVVPHFNFSLASILNFMLPFLSPKFPLLRLRRDQRDKWSFFDLIDFL